jgi:hypothetical protein
MSREVGPVADGAPLLVREQEDLLLRAATRAPSMHNTQPWAFGVGRNHIELYADASRQLRQADPGGRALHVSCGAALFNLRVAAAHLRLHHRVRLLPQPADRTLVAVVELEHRLPRQGSLAGYYRAVWLRRTNRRPFHDRAVPSSAVTRMVEAATVEGALLRVFDDPAEVHRIIELVAEADRIERADLARTTERQRWVGGHHRDEGVPTGALGPRPVGRVPFRDLGYAVEAVREVATFEPAPTIAVLSTPLDQPVDWLRAGQALERVLLEATMSGISVSFLNQPLEHHELRWLVRNPLRGAGYSHMLLRLGYGDPVPLTPRRPVSDVRRPALLTD